MMSNAQRSKWIMDRAEALVKAPEPTGADAALVAGPPDADLLKRVSEGGTVAHTTMMIDRHKRMGTWSDAQRVAETCMLRAVIERGIYDACEQLGVTVYTLPIPELARRAAALEIALADGCDRAEFVALLLECVFGRGANVATWSCPNGHQGYAQQDELLAIDPCPCCGLLLQRWRAVN